MLCALQFFMEVILIENRNIKLIMKKIKSIKNLSVVLLLASTSILLLSGCASITRGTKEVLVVNSEPMNACVHLSNGMVGTTPASFKIPRDSVVTVVIDKPGYKTAVVHVNHEFATAGGVGMAGNILFGGIIGIGIDAVSGATQDLTPNPVCVILEPISHGQELAADF